MNSIGALKLLINTPDLNSTTSRNSRFSILLPKAFLTLLLPSSSNVRTFSLIAGSAALKMFNLRSGFHSFLIKDASIAAVEPSPYKSPKYILLGLFKVGLLLQLSPQFVATISMSPSLLKSPVATPFHHPVNLERPS